jgi:hypothetical protein
VRSIFGIVFAVLFGVVVGLGSAFLALEAEVGFNRVTVGPWIGNPRAGGINADPYTRAALVRSGELPVGGGEGITFIARRDSNGRSLDARCTYVVAGDPPPARWWTLTVYTPEGRLLGNPAGRYGFTSREVRRNRDGRYEVVVARRARSGDWLPVETDGAFKLVMRLYDTPLATATGLVTPVLPEIKRERCA